MSGNLAARVIGVSQIWLINLERRKDRFERFMQRHPEMSGRINRLAAYDGKSLKLTPKLARLFLPNNFEWHKPTMGCAMSHLALWCRLAAEADENASYLILEDDALLEPSWVAKVEKTFLTGAVPPDWEVLFLGGILPKYRETFEKNVQPVNRIVARVNPDCTFGDNPRGYFHFCAYAYLLNNRGARRLLDLIESGNGIWMQADFFACYTTPELSPPRPIYFFHPLLAQSFQDSAEGYVKPYTDEDDETARVDSDIWKDKDKFSGKQIDLILSPDAPLDIPGALGLPVAVRSPSTEKAVQPDSAKSRHRVKKVGLVCATYNNAEQLKVALESIKKHTDPSTYDLYVVDDASTDDAAAVCSQTWPANFIFIRCEEKVGWAEAVKSCLPELGEYAYVGFLHDNIDVGPRWLDYLTAILDRHQEVGAVGPLTSNDRDWQGYDRFRKGPARPGLPELRGIERSDVVAMSHAMSAFNPGVTVNDPVLASFCILIRTELIAKIASSGQAHTDHRLGDDFGKRVLAAGYQLAVSFNAYVAHNFGHQSLSSDDHGEGDKKLAQITSAERKKREYRTHSEISDQVAGDLTASALAPHAPTKLIGLYRHWDIPHLEQNHKSFAERNGMEYRKYKIHDFFDKWALVYDLLESHPGQTLVFIDAFSYFVSADFNLDLSEPIIISELHGRVMDNFFVVRSCQTSLKTFHEILTRSNHQFVWEGSFHFDVPLPEGIAKPYGFQIKNGNRLNLDLLYTDRGKYFGVNDLPLGICANLPVESPYATGSVNDILVARYGGNDWPSRLWCVAEIICHYRPKFALTYESQPDFEVVNPGKSRALVTLSSTEPDTPTPEYVAVSELNFRRYAQSHDVTLYIYKGVPPAYAGIHSTWTKPYLVREHLPTHDYVSWVDADILISGKFRLPEGEDVVVYNDPGLLFNAGFMTFRNSPKTTDYLQDVIAKCEGIQDRTHLHTNGGDQRQFIEQYKVHFLDSRPRSHLHANVHPALGKLRDPSPGLLHFMGINPPSVRAIVMDYYDKSILDADAIALTSDNVISKVHVATLIDDRNSVEASPLKRTPVRQKFAAASEAVSEKIRPRSDTRLAKISLLHATRRRSAQAVDARRLWLEKASKPERVEHIFAFDHDDESSDPLKKFHHVIQLDDGYSVGAWNLAAKHATGDILMQMSDDWDPPAGWDDLVAGSLDIASERVLWVNEDYTRKDIMCMAILTRKYYEKYGLFDPRFKNVYSDDDFTAKAKKRSAITYANNIVFKHKHFTTGDSPVDATYQRCNDHNEYRRAKILFDSIHNAPDADGADIVTADNHTIAESGLEMKTVNESGDRVSTPMTDHRPPVVPKAHHADWSGRFREVISDPLCILIEKHPLAGSVSGNDVYLHTGLKVPLSGPLSYYSEFSQILAINRGIHEPLEEFVFQQVIFCLPQKPRMLELGAYWAHYSMWLLANRPEASVCMVEPDQAGLEAGIHNFKTNGFEGEFINAFVQAGGFEVDKHMETTGLRHLDILHADIQGHELQMLQGARNTLSRKQIDYVFVSTHSQELHEQVCHVLTGLGYRVEVEADFDSETTSFDGFVFATSPVVPPVFRNFKPLGRVAITNTNPDAVFEYLKEVRSSINPVVASSYPFLREVSGVIHVGANTGQERHLYNAYGLGVLWVEPLPEVFAELEANIRGIAGQTALNALLADVDGKEYDLNVANNGGESSSILELKLHRNIWPEVEYVSKVRCQSTTLPALLEKAGIQAGKYDALVLDTQGSELLVLRGAISLLQGFKFIKVEVPDFESYDGCCRDSEVSAFMAEHNFEEVFRSRLAWENGTGNYFDVVYKRRS